MADNLYDPYQRYVQTDNISEPPSDMGGPSYLIPGANHDSQVPGHVADQAQTTQGAQASNAQDFQHFTPPPQPDFGALSDAIRRQQSPYVAFGAHGWLQDNHPQVAGRLDNALAAVANTTSGRTTAENIAGVARGVIGGRQMEQQHAMEQATLPLTLAHQQMAYQAGLMNLYKSGAEINKDNAMADYYGTHGDYLTGRLGQLGNQTGNVVVDDNGEPWAQGKNGQGLQYAGNNPQVDSKYQPTFNKHNQKGGAGGGLWSNIAAAADQPGATPQENANNRLNLYNKSQATNAGGKKAATDQAAIPAQTANDFLKSEKDKVAAQLGKRPDDASQKDFTQNYLISHMNDPSFDISKLPSLESRQSDYDKKAGDMKDRFSRYTASNDWRKSKSFSPDDYAAPQAQAAPAKKGGLDSALDSLFPKQ